MPSARHVLKQLEWIQKLKEEYNCVFVSMEISSSRTPLKKYLKLKRRYIFDVYGVDANDKIYVVEIGYIHKKKYDRLRTLSDSLPHGLKLEFFYISLKSEVPEVTVSDKGYLIFDKGFTRLEIEGLKLQLKVKNPKPYEELEELQERLRAINNYVAEKKISPMCNSSLEP